MGFLQQTTGGLRPPLLAAVLLLASACGSSQEQVPGEDNRPERPERLFNSRFQGLGPWWPALAARVNPGHPADPWPGEVLAQRVRAGMLALVSDGLQLSSGASLAYLGKRSTLVGRLRPDELDTVHSAPGYRVQRGVPREMSRRTGTDQVRQGFGELVAPHVGRARPRVDAFVNECAQGEDGLYQTRVHLRIASGEHEGLQTNLRLSATWRVGTRRAVLAELSCREFEELRLEQRTLIEATAAVLGSGARDHGWIWEGALQRQMYTDNLVVFTDTYLAMHGAGIGDLDGDGLEDLYVARQGGAPNRLLRQLPDGSVQDVAEEAQVDFLEDTSGVLVADLDGDGARDLALGIGTEVVICWNDGEGRFDAPLRLARESQDKVYSISAADADGDGDLDLYDTRYFSSNYGGGIPTPYHDARNGAPNSFWRNQGERRFSEATSEAGLDVGNDRFSLTALWEDLDADGDQDLYVVNDFGRNNYFRNDDGRFVDVSAAAGLGDRAAGMGVSPSDVDGDGDTDLYVSNMYSAPGRRITADARFQASASEEVRRSYRRHTRGNTLLLNDGQGLFVDASPKSMAAPGGWSWGALFADLNNDGVDDLVVPNGFVTGSDSRDLAGFFWRCVVSASPTAPPATAEYQNAWQAITRLSQSMGYSWSGNERNFTYLGLGGGLYADASMISGAGWLDDGRSALRVDWDMDGRLDLWLKNRTAPILRLLHNRDSAPGSWVGFELVGHAPNTEAVGAVVEVHSGELVRRRGVQAGEGFLGSPSKRLHFGLASAPRVDEVRVIWPDGSVQSTAGVPVGSWYRWAQGEPRPLPLVRPGVASALQEPEQRLAANSRPTHSCLVALERLPYAALPLPAFDGPGGLLSDHAGRCVLVFLWAGWDAAAPDQLAALARAEEGLSKAGLDLHPLSMDGPRHSGYAQRMVTESALRQKGGRCDRRCRPLLELALQAVMGVYEDLELPIGLLFDPVGSLVAVHFGAPDAGLLAQQSRALARPDARDRGVHTYSLSGGRWLGVPPRRVLQGAIEFLRNTRAEEQLACGLEALLESR